jgi:hypothetical protein
VVLVNCVPFLNTQLLRPCSGLQRDKLLQVEYGVFLLALDPDFRACRVCEQSRTAVEEGTGGRHASHRQPRSRGWEAKTQAASARDLPTRSFSTISIMLAQVAQATLPAAVQGGQGTVRTTTHDEGSTRGGQSHAPQTATATSSEPQTCTGARRSHRFAAKRRGRPVGSYSFGPDLCITNLCNMATCLA